MDTIRIAVKDRKTRAMIEADALIPSDLGEAISLMGEEKVYQWARTAAVVEAKKRLASSTSRRRRKLLKIDIDKLTLAQKELLIDTGLMKRD